jgi:hypothetical protein
MNLVFAPIELTTMAYDNENFKLNFSPLFRLLAEKSFRFRVFSSDLALLSVDTMPCFSSFCCGYGLRSGGSVIGYFSIAVYVKLMILCLVFLWCIKERIEDSEGAISGYSLFNEVTSIFRSKPKHFEIENTLRELKSEHE